MRSQSRVSSHDCAGMFKKKLELGHLPRPHVQRKNESPSRQRRQNRWVEAWRLAAEDDDNEELTVRTDVTAVADKVTVNDEGLRADIVDVNAAVVEPASGI